MRYKSAHTRRARWIAFSICTSKSLSALVPPLVRRGHFAVRIARIIAVAIERETVPFVASLVFVHSCLHRASGSRLFSLEDP